MKFSSIPILLLFSFFLIFTPMSAQQEQSVAHGGIHMKIPSDWFAQTQSSPNGNETINSGKRGETNSFTINKINVDLSTKEGLELAKKMTSGYDFFKNAAYTEYKAGKFNGYPSNETSFSGNLQGEIFKGKMISFKSGNKVYLIMYMGSDSYNRGKVLRDILASIKVN